MSLLQRDAEPLPELCRDAGIPFRAVLPAGVGVSRDAQPSLRRGYAVLDR